MNNIGTFGSFTTAQLGIYAAQNGLSVTGNNIANINTVGYTRQNLDQISFRTGGTDRYKSQLDVRVGMGVLCTGVSQIRDPYLDIRYRNELSQVGALDGKLTGLQNLASILDEVAKGKDQNGVIEAQLGELLNTLQNLSNNVNDQSADIQVRSAASALASLFNSYSKRLEDLENNTIKGLDQNIDKVNEILTGIRDLNESIRKSEMHGDRALEMRDERNRLIDELSSYMKIDVIYSMEDVGGGQMIEKLTIKLGNANPDEAVTTDSTTLIDGIYGAQISDKIPQPNPNFNDQVPPGPNNPPYLDAQGNPTENKEDAPLVHDENYNITVSELRDSRDRVLRGSTEVKLDDNDIQGSLQAMREMLTESGEFAPQDYINNVDENAASKRGIPYYRKTLDLLANQIASVFNQANEGYMQDQDGNFLDTNGQIVQPALPDGTILTAKNYDPNNPDHKRVMEASTAEKKGGPLFSNRGDRDATDGITAGNISVSNSWSKGDVHIVASFKKPAGMDVGSTDNTNVLHMISLMGTKMDYLPSAVAPDAGNIPMFHGTFQEMLGNIGSVLGNDQAITQIKLDSSYTSAVELDTSRDGVSGVDLNDEASNLMKYQKSYSAACRLMTTLDEALEKLINNTGIVGR